MLQRLLLSSFAVLVVTSPLATASSACDHAATACQASHASAYVPLPSVASPVPLGFLPLLEGVSVQPIVSGLRAYLDPESGLITSPIGGLQAPADLAMESDYSNLPQVQLPNGSWMIDTRGMMGDEAVITIDALGHRAFSCVHAAPHAMVTAPIIAPSPYAER
jgi:hypothetical protein